VEAARAAGALMRRNQNATKRINSEARHDIKLELDVRCQKLIEKLLRRTLPAAAVLGEEGDSGEARAALRWVIDPIDGTVNFTYGIPHACVSIALQARRPGEWDDAYPDANYETVVGVVYDPFPDELWTAIKGQPARLNGRITRASSRGRLAESIVSVGFAKHRETMELILPTFQRLLYEARKVRLMGAAALAITYVASGRFDAYLEYGLRLWDIAAAGLILECAGGEFWREPMPGEHTYHIIANNGLLRKKLFPPKKK